MPKNKTRRQNKRRNKQESLHPPAFKNTFQFKHRIRYQNADAGSPTVRNITRANMLNTLLVNQSSSTGNFRILSAIKLNRVEIWGLSGSGASDYGASSVVVEWLSQYSPTSEVTDSGTALYPAHVVTTPPRQSIASFWSMSGSNESEVLFKVIAPPGAIMDIWYDMVLQDGQGPTSVGTTASGVAGTLYYSHADGPDASSTWAPVSLTSLN